MSKTIYRFKFSENVIDMMKEFSRIHKHDDRNDFKEAWEDWVKNNNILIEVEMKRLESLGFQGDIIDKMYKSIRYYYCKKTNKKQEPKQRRKYTTIHKEVLTMIDRHIENGFEQNNHFKPSDGYKDFMTNQCELMDDTIKELKQNGLTNEDIENKMKKTYKNRYFIIQKK